jgi:hypothetical protein
MEALYFVCTCLGTFLFLLLFASYYLDNDAEGPAPIANPGGAESKATGGRQQRGKSST